jgi:hypothetical protein
MKIIIDKMGKRGNKIQFAVGDDGYALYTIVDGSVSDGLAGFTPAPKHDFGAEYTHKLGACLATRDEVSKVEAIQQAMRDARNPAKIIPGYSEMKASLNDAERYHAEFTRMVEDEQNDGVCPPKSGKSDPEFYMEILRAKYPVAACYIKAEGYSYASHDCKSFAGHKAMALLISGGSVEEAEKILENWLPESSQWA